MEDVSQGIDTLTLAVRDRFGFLRPDEIALVATDPQTRLQPLLVRCGGCRFTAAAQDIAHLIDIINRDGWDHVRDVSVPATIWDKAWSE